MLQKISITNVLFIWTFYSKEFWKKSIRQKRCFQQQ